MLDELLTYHQTPKPDDFVAGVMRSIKRQQRMRKLILTATGLVGAVFGAAGMLQLSEALERIFSEASLLPVSTAVVLSVAFLTWLLHDEAVLVD